MPRSLAMYCTQEPMAMSSSLNRPGEGLASNAAPAATSLTRSMLTTYPAPPPPHPPTYPPCLLQDLAPWHLQAAQEPGSASCGTRFQLCLQRLRLHVHRCEDRASLGVSIRLAGSRTGKQMHGIAMDADASPGLHPRINAVNKYGV